MNRETSLYLDVCRFLAAMTVFIGHVAGKRFTDGFLWQIGPFMGEAVAVFFVLSGFVIAYAVDSREQSARAYAVARAARIYSVALPALIITFALDAWGRSVRPELYSMDWGYVFTGQVWQFLSGLFFVNQIWFSDIQTGSNLPYWSLGYEIWYYLLFGVAMFAPARWRVIWVVVLLALVGPPIAAMFPLWLIGLFTYRLSTRATVSRPLGWALFLGSLVVWAGYEIWRLRNTGLAGVAPAFLQREELAQDYLIGILFMAHLVGFKSVSSTFAPILKRFARSIRWTAGATFSVYLFHLPIAQFLTTQVPWPASSWMTRLAIVGGTLVCVFVLAEFTERRKELWRRGFDLLLRPRARAQTA